MSNLIRLGRYIMFDAPILVQGDPDSRDGAVDARWADEDHFLRMTIGLNNDWPQVVKTALHECVEEAFVLRRCHFRPHGSLNVGGDDQCMMIARHHEFTDICAHAGDMLAYMLPDLRKAWDELQKPKQEAGVVYPEKGE